MDLNEILKKYTMTDDDEGTEMQRREKAVLKAGLASGAISAEKAMAQLILENHAKQYREKNPEVTPEQSFVKVMELHPELGGMAIG